MNTQQQQAPACAHSINLNADIDGQPSIIELDHPDKPIGFRCPIRLYVVGPSQSGKSRLVTKLIEEMPDWFDVKFQACFFMHPPSELASGIRQSSLQPIQNSCIKYNVPFSNISANPLDIIFRLEQQQQEHRLLIIDDMGSTVTDDPRWADVFMRISHRTHLSIILISQNFYSGKRGPEIRRNCSDFIIFKSLREENYIRNIAKDLLKGNTTFLEKCFEWLGDNVTKSYDRYLVIDSNEGSDPFLPYNHLAYFGVKTNLFKDDKTGVREVIYFPCSSLK